MMDTVRNALSACVNNKEGFETERMRTSVISIVSFVVVELLVLLLGQWLWNSSLVNLVTIVRPVSSMWHLLGVSVLFRLMFN